MEFKACLKLLADQNGSDLFLTADAPPVVKIDGRMKPLDNDRLSPQQIKKIAYAVMDEDQIAEFKEKPEMNLALMEPGIGRFRVNIFKQQHQLAMVVRNIQTQIPNIDKLGLPKILKKIMMQKRGLVLFVGATGSGKSTSLAAMIDHRNSHATDHIITIEDPIECIHSHKNSLVNQREVGIDTDSYEDALKNALRQAPDVVMIGEIRARETMEHAISFAETGHLYLSTLHANNADQALDRIINFFPEDRRDQLLMDLSLNVRAFVSQRLVQTVDGKRVAAIEILLGTPLIKDLIRKGDVHLIKEVMEKSENIGMQTFDSHLLKMYQQGLISLEEALRHSDSPNNLRLEINLEEKGKLHQAQPRRTDQKYEMPKLELDPLNQHDGNMFSSHEFRPA